jgi:hypothetical protein
MIFEYKLERVYNRRVAAFVLSKYHREIGLNFQYHSELNNIHGGHGHSHGQGHGHAHGKEHESETTKATDSTTENSEGYLEKKLK